MSKLARIVTIATVAGCLLWAAPAVPQPGSICVGRCGKALRECLEGDRPAMRACLRACNIGLMSCPSPAVGGECPDVRGTRGCVHVCRDMRRQEVRGCLAEARGCLVSCQGPTPTPTR